MKINVKFPKVQKGGIGSGHKGHSGRPGKRGGSLPGGGTSQGSEENPYGGVEDILKKRNTSKEEISKKVSRIGGDHFDISNIQFEQAYLKPQPKGSPYRNVPGYQNEVYVSSDVLFKGKKVGDLSFAVRGGAYELSIDKNLVDDYYAKLYIKNMKAKLSNVSGFHG